MDVAENLSTAKKNEIQHLMHMVQLVGILPECICIKFESYSLVEAFVRFESFNTVFSLVILSQTHLKGLYKILFPLSGYVAIFMLSLYSNWGFILLISNWNSQNSSSFDVWAPETTTHLLWP